MWVKCLIPDLANPTTIRIASKVQGSKYDKSQKAALIQIVKQQFSKYLWWHSNFNALAEVGRLSANAKNAFNSFVRRCFCSYYQNRKKKRVLANRSCIAFKAQWKLYKTRKSKKNPNIAKNGVCWGFPAFLQVLPPCALLILIQILIN